MAKVYFCKFVHKNTGKVFYKFGHTSKWDVLERFDTKFDTRYGDFNITCVASIVGSLEWCQSVEEIFKSIFPKNIWLEKYLGEGNWDNFSGITEIVDLTPEQYDNARQAFYNLKKKVTDVKSK
jgi:hypothetical protein